MIAFWIRSALALFVSGLLLPGFAIATTQIMDVPVLIEDTLFFCLSSDSSSLLVAWVVGGEGADVFSADPLLRKTLHTLSSSESASSIAYSFPEHGNAQLWNGTSPVPILRDNPHAVPFYVTGDALVVSYREWWDYTESSMLTGAYRTIGRTFGFYPSWGVRKGRTADVIVTDTQRDTTSRFAPIPDRKDAIAYDFAATMIREPKALLMLAYRVVQREKGFGKTVFVLLSPRDMTVAASGETSLELLGLGPGMCSSLCYDAMTHQVKYLQMQAADGKIEFEAIRLETGENQICGRTSVKIGPAAIVSLCDKDSSIDVFSLEGVKVKSVPSHGILVLVGVTADGKIIGLSKDLNTLIVVDSLLGSGKKTSFAIDESKTPATVTVIFTDLR